MLSWVLYFALNNNNGAALFLNIGNKQMCFITEKFYKCYFYSVSSYMNENVYFDSNMEDFCHMMTS